MEIKRTEHFRLRNYDKKYTTIFKDVFNTRNKSRKNQVENFINLTENGLKIVFNFSGKLRDKVRNHFASQ